MVARLGAGLALALTLAGCSALEIVNALAPIAHLERQRALAYGEHPRQRLDVYRPRNAPSPAPVVVFFYGGSWDSGERDSYLFVAEALVSRGFVVVVPDYRIHPEVGFPVFLEDAAAAVAWARRHAASYGGDPRELFVMGHSAGGHIAAMMALDGRYLAREGLSPRELSGFIGLSGPYDFLPLKDDKLKRIFAPAGTLDGTQPINFVSASAPPALLATGETDSVVSPGNSLRLAAKLRAAGVPVRELRYPGLDHYTIIGAIALPLRIREPLLDEIERFIRANKKGAAAAPRPSS